MAIDTVGRIQQRGPAAERDRMKRPPQRLLDRLEPFSFSQRGLGIRAEDAQAFSAVAVMTECAILVRSTNPRSLRYIGVKGYVPKPIDCKAKTAKQDGTKGRCWLDCAGLVVDPGLVGDLVFDGKHAQARKEWAAFIGANRPCRLGNGVEIFRRADGKGFYAVDLADPDVAGSRHGCLLVSRQEAPADFDTRSRHSRRWIERHMSYLHGDYDLFAILDQGDFDRDQGPRQSHVRSEQVMGTENRFTGRTHEIQQLLNSAIGCDMVQHGEQAALSLSVDDIYVFDSFGGKWLLREPMYDGAHADANRSAQMKGALADLLRYVYATELVRPPRKP